MTGRIEQAVNNRSCVCIHFWTLIWSVEKTKSKRSKSTRVVITHHTNKSLEARKVYKNTVGCKVGLGGEKGNIGGARKE